MLRSILYLDTREIVHICFWKLMSHFLMFELSHLLISQSVGPTDYYCFQLVIVGYSFLDNFYQCMLVCGNWLYSIHFFYCSAKQYNDQPVALKL